MSTAIRPSTAKNWDEVFSKEKGYPDEGNIWTSVNEILYSMALHARFGSNSTPHPFEGSDHDRNVCDDCGVNRKEHKDRLTVAQTSMLSYLDFWMKHEKVLNASYGSDEYNEIVTQLGNTMINFIRIAATNPIVGHFVGRGFEQNQKDADAFLGND